MLSVFIVIKMACVGIVSLLLIVFREALYFQCFFKPIQFLRVDQKILVLKVRNVMLNLRRFQ